MSPPRHRGRALDWARSPLRAELLALYAEADEALGGWECACSSAAPGVPPCCDAAVLGREPYPTAVELEEVRHAMRALGVVPRRADAAAGRLPLAPGTRPCPLLSDEGRCRVYTSRPLGCRTFFCDGAESPDGPRGKIPRAALGAVGRRIADLSARFDPHDPLPRSLHAALLGGRR